jgi:hypothetical protein
MELRHTMYEYIQAMQEKIEYEKNLEKEQRKNNESLKKNNERTTSL